GHGRHGVGQVLALYSGSLAGNHDRLQLEIVPLEPRLDGILASRYPHLFALVTDASNLEDHVPRWDRDGKRAVILDGGRDSATLYRHLSRCERLGGQGIGHLTGDDAGLGFPTSCLALGEDALGVLTVGGVSAPQQKTQR